MPHPQAFRRIIRSSLDQMRRSIYILLFKMPRGIPEQALLALRAAALRSVYQGKVSRPQVNSNVHRLSQPGALAAALNWYRALKMNDRTGPISVPTLYIWGDRDVALGEKAALATRREVTGEYRFERLSGISHWLVDEQPNRIAALLVEHLNRYSTQGEQDGR